MNGYLNKQLGDYRIVEEIGSGGMGRVYRAQHVHLKKDFAVKILPEKLAGDKGFVRRFYDEARVMADFRHPAIVQVHATSCRDGVYFLAMDYVNGPAHHAVRKDRATPPHKRGRQPSPKRLSRGEIHQGPNGLGGGKGEVRTGREGSSEGGCRA